MRSTKRRHGIAPIILLAVLALSGCGSIRLHSDVRDKQGMAAKDAWAAVDLSRLVTIERANLKKLLDVELETQDRLAAGIHNHELRSMVEAKSLKEGLVDPVNLRLTTIAGDSAEVASSRERLSKFRKKTIQVETIATELMMKRLALPTCASVANNGTPAAIERWRKSAAPISLVEVDAALAELRKVCGNPENDIVQSVFTGIGGEVAVALKQYADDALELKQSEQSAVELKLKYQVELSAYNKAIAEPTADATDRVKTTLGRLRDAVAALEASQDALAIQFLSKERLDSLEKFFDVVTQATGDGSVPDSDNKAAVAFILLPGLIDDARKSLAEAKKPLALPLLIRWNYEQLKLDAANREIEARRTKVSLSKELVETLYEQAVQLWLASRELNHENVKKLHGLRMSDALNVKSADEKELVYTSARRYLDVVNRLSARRYKLEYMRIATLHELGLAYAEVNIKHWQSLIGATVDQVAGSAASGIKAENVSALLNTVGVFWIGHGVNK